ncbi:TPA: hypothetical protein ACOSSF_005759, partial [Escherichia coli]
AKNESEQWDYINRATKRHNCRITGKEKATCHGGQCDQCGGLLVAINLWVLYRAALVQRAPTL